MANLDLAAFNTKWASPTGRFAENGTGEITEADFQEFALDINETFRDALTGGPVNGEGSIYHAAWFLTAINEKTFSLDTLANAASMPDIKARSPISLHVGGHVQYIGFDYSFTARTITIIGEYDPEITKVGTGIYFVYDTGAGNGSSGENGPAFTISAGDRISFGEGTEQVPGVPDIIIHADPEVVTNQVDAASGLAIPGTLTEVTSATGDDIKSTGVKIVGPRRVPVPASQSSPGVQGQRARNTTTGDVYEYDMGQWWWENAPTQAERKTFTT